jgi:hypothetical protein
MISNIFRSLAYVLPFFFASHPLGVSADADADADAD